MGEITGKKYDTVVFDMDGTLLDTLEDLRDAVNYALRMHGMPERTTEEIRRFVGNGVRKLLVRSVPEGDKNPEFEAVFQAFREYYAVHSNDKTHAYKGVTELLKKLRDAGYAVAIVSNKPDAAVKNLNQIYFDGIVETAIGEREGMDKKPAPDMVWKAIEELGKTKETAVYVGTRRWISRRRVMPGCPASPYSGDFGSGIFLRRAGRRCLLRHRRRCGCCWKRGNCRKRAAGHRCRIPKTEIPALRRVSFFRNMLFSL